MECNLFITPIEFLSTNKNAKNTIKVDNFETRAK